MGQHPLPVKTLTNACNSQRQSKPDGFKRGRLKMRKRIMRVATWNVQSTSLKRLRKKSLRRCLVEGVMMYGSELWVENKSKKATAVVVQENRNWKEFPMRKSGE
jgi:hypothetical protein